MGGGAGGGGVTMLYIHVPRCDFLIGVLQLRVEDTSDVDTSLREPLLFEELTRVNDYSNGS